MPIQSRNRRQQRRRSLKMRGGEEKDIMDKLVEIEGKIDGLNTLIMQGNSSEEVPKEEVPKEEDIDGASGTDDASDTASDTGNGTDGASGDNATGLINSKEKLKTPETPETPENNSEMPGGRRNSRRRRQRNNRKSQRRQRRR